MTTGEMRPADPGTEAALRRLAARYATAVDNLDATALTGVFTPDAVLSVEPAPGARAPQTTMRGRAEIASIPEQMSRWDRTFHFLGQGLYLVGDDGPGRARGEVYCIAHHRRGERDLVMYIRYQDAYAEQADGEWLILTRRVLVDWTDTHHGAPAPEGGQR